MAKDISVRDFCPQRVRKQKKIRGSSVRNKISHDKMYAEQNMLHRNAKTHAGKSPIRTQRGASEQPNEELMSRTWQE